MSTERFNFTPNFVVGIGIMLVGVALMLDRIGVVEARALLWYWPVLLILLGASIVVQAYRGDAGSPPGSGPERPIVTPSLVILGVIAFFLVSHVQRRADAAAEGPGAETVSLFAVMGSDDRASQATRFRGGLMTTVMGRTRLDLRQSVVAPGEEAVIDLFALMGGVVIHVPRGWTVDVQAVQVMGGVKDERPRAERRAEAAQPPPGELERADPASEEQPPRVVLRGLIIMGGLTIRS